MACFEVKLWSILTLRAVCRFSGTLVGTKLLTTAELVGVGSGNCFSKFADTWLKQLVGILLPGNCFPAAACGVANPGIVQPDGISDGLEAQEMGTKMGMGVLLLLGLTKPLKSPESSACVGSVMGPCPTDFLYRS